MDLVGMHSLLGLLLGMIGWQSMTAGLLRNSTNTGISSAAQFDRPDQGIKGGRAISVLAAFSRSTATARPAIRWRSTTGHSVCPPMPSQREA